ncbi:hypothetical protein [Rugamonas sp.]|uniref:hypothetical protein n=1 Tax=Rugamonas sp. TaxID=1926287 RepID=UPI0025D81CB8|nr:hypothetical protein [Rugamonas sp.]
MPCSPMQVQTRRVRRAARQAGIALPVMLIMLAVMLMSSIYLLKSSTSTTLTTSNLAYDAALSKAVDLGIYTGYTWIAAMDKNNLYSSIPAVGYVANMVPSQSVNDPNFWLGSVKFNDTASPPNQIEYVIHRMCSLVGAPVPDAPFNNNCMKSTMPNTASATAPLLVSLGVDAPQLAVSPQLHYLITARIFGPRGGNVVNQAVALISE